MKIVIVEDEQHSARMLEGMIQSLKQDWTVLAVLESVKQSVEWFKNHDMPDLVFMDIQLTDGICFSIFEQVQINSMVVFTTAYDNYAIQAFEVNSIDYLLKPIKEEKLEQAIDKFDTIVNRINEEIENSSSSVNQASPNYKDLLSAIKEEKKVYRQRFLISGSSSFFKIETKDIAYFYTVNRVTFAVLFDGKEHIIDVTMEKLEDQLDPKIFFRANRSQIICLDVIYKFETFFGGKLNLKLIHPFKETITISRLKATEFKNWLDQ